MSLKVPYAYSCHAGTGETKTHGRTASGQMCRNGIRGINIYVPVHIKWYGLDFNTQSIDVNNKNRNRILFFYKRLQLQLEWKCSLCCLHVLVDAIMYFFSRGWTCLPTYSVFAAGNIKSVDTGASPRSDWDWDGYAHHQTCVLCLQLEDIYACTDGDGSTFHLQMRSNGALNPAADTMLHYICIAVSFFTILSWERARFHTRSSVGVCVCARVNNQSP